MRFADPDNDGGHVVVEIRDDGEGFDHDRANGGFGLLGMRERVSLLRDELDVVSQAGRGATVSARIPVERRADSEREPVRPSGG